MKQTKLFAMTLLSTALFVGCSGGTVSVETETVEPVSTPAKDILLEIAETGVGGSAAMDARDALGDSNPEIAAGIDEIMNMSDANKIKAKAKELADKL